jgi:hypothetical protein
MCISSAAPTVLGVALRDDHVGASDVALAVPQ